MSLCILEYLDYAKFDSLCPGPVLITMDADWAPDFVLEEVLKAIPKGFHITFFATNPSPVLDDFGQAGHEIGAHPNFLPGSTHGKSPEEILARMRRHFPNAKGLRSHCLYQSSPLQEKIAQARFYYDCNQLLYMQNYLQPYRDWYGLFRVPYSWEDNVCCNVDRNFEPEYWLDKLSGPGLKILNFHPVLIALNVDSTPAQNYVDLKRAYPDLLDVPKRNFDGFRNTGEGIGSLFRGLIARLSDR